MPWRQDVGSHTGLCILQRTVSPAEALLHAIRAVNSMPQPSAMLG